LRHKVRKLKAVFFDAYGTLFHYEPEKLNEVFRDIVDKFRISVNPNDLITVWRKHEQIFRDTRTRYENGRWKSSDEFFSYKEAWKKCFELTYNEFGVDNISANLSVEMILEDLKKRAIYREVPEVLKQVRSKFPIGIISNADTDFLLDSIKNNSLAFDLIMTSEGVESYKPHPYIFEKALEYFGADPDEVLYVGDSPLEDIIGPQKLGIPSVWVNRKGLDWSLGKENQPYAEITDLLQLLDVINSKQNISY
jgi:2-haloalkanoic acid dehalogenase type II